MNTSFNHPRVVVWGARGFIGRHLVAELIARQYAVSVITRGGPGAPPSWASHATWHELGPRDRGRVFAGALADATAVFNLAGSSGAVASNRAPLESLDANCRLQLEFLEACAATRRVPHVVFASSRLVYAPKGAVPVTEGDAVAPRSMYAAHKLCVEHYHEIYARAEAVTCTIARISNPFGPDADAGRKGYGVINALIEHATRRVPMVLFGGGGQRRDYLYVRDLVDALILCAERPEARDETFNIGRGRSVSMYEAALSISERIGGGGIDFAPWPLEYERVETGDFVFDVSKAAARLGFRSRYDLASGLDEMLGCARADRPHAGEATDPYAAVRQAV